MSNLVIRVGENKLSLSQLYAQDKMTSIEASSYNVAYNPTQYGVVTSQPMSPSFGQTTVVVNQPMMGKHWNTQLFDCFADIKICKSYMSSIQIGDVE